MYVDVSVSECERESVCVWYSEWDRDRECERVCQIEPIPVDRFSQSSCQALTCNATRNKATYQPITIF